MINTEEVQAWDGHSKVAMQCLSFAYSVGAILGPLVTRPFLAPKATPGYSPSNSSRPSNSSQSVQSFDQDINRQSANILQPFGSNSGQLIDINFNDTSSSWGASNSSSIQTNEFEPPTPKSNLVYAYIITGSLMVVVSLAFYATTIRTCCLDTPHHSHKKKSAAASSANRQVPRKVFLAVVAVCGAFYLFYLMALESFNQYYFFFVVTHLDWSKDSGVYLTTLHKSVNASMKFLVGAVIYRYFSDSTVLSVSAVGMVLSVGMFCMAAQFQIDALVWVAMTCLSLCQAALFFGVMPWIDNNLVKVTGKITSFLYVCVGLGPITAPIPLGYLMKHVSLLVFPYYVFCSFIVSTSVFLVMRFVIHPTVRRQYGPLRAAIGNSEMMAENEQEGAAMMDVGVQVS